MPYSYKKVGNKYCVYKKGTNEKIGCTDANKESLRKYLAALHINTNEMTQSQKTTQLAMIDQQINKLELQVAALQKKKELINKQTPIQEFKLSGYFKTLLEAPDPEDAPDSSADADPNDKETDSENDADTPQKSNLTVKFNMSKAKKYNKYPVTDNTGTVTGVSKEGITVLVGDNTIFINYEDILS